MPNQITQCYHLNTDIEFTVFRIQKGVLYLCMVAGQGICIVIRLYRGMSVMTRYEEVAGILRERIEHGIYLSLIHI